VDRSDEVVDGDPLAEVTTVTCRQIQAATG
jgi:hypothetical protein